ncbi:MAG: hypothetical protein WCB94_14740 [Terriglobales bacterium]
MTEPRLLDELQKMEKEYEPLLPVEKKLIWYTFATGVVLLAALVLISRAFI